MNWVEKFVGVRPKIYYYSSDDGSGDKKKLRKDLSLKTTKNAYKTTKLY